MNNLVLILLLLSSIVTYSQEITRGPEPGEIYFLGPTATVLHDAFYYSTDFGESAVCQDSVSCTTTIIGAIIADKTSGGLYYNNISEALYYSEDHGKYGTWEQKNSGIANVLHAGVLEGHIYNGPFIHSEDYGSSFITHQLNNYFGIWMESEIGYADKGYVITYELGGNDTLYFSVSYDNFENLELVNKFLEGELGLHDLSYGYNDGDLYYYNSVKKELLYTDNDGYAWVRKNTFFCPNLPILGITGGRQDGELYMLVEYLQMAGLRRHTYIYHSLDHGETFTVYHPVAIGPDPIYANFIAEDTLVEPGDTVQFFDLSNDAETWQWDFDNDGTIDSYEQNPTYIYQDTGYYTVKLSIFGVGGVVYDYGIRYDYIHVDDLTSSENRISLENSIKVYPIPTNNNLTIKTVKEIKKISIYNSNGDIIKTVKYNKPNSQESKLLISTSDFDTGVYYFKIDFQNYSETKKIIITH